MVGGQMSGVLILSNCDEGDTTFDSDMGTWNITRATRDCNAGKHKVWGFDTFDLFQAIKNVEIDEKKINGFSSLKDLINTPPIILIVEKGKVWVIDGHHRIHAHWRNNITRMSGFVIEEKDSAPYIIWFNGQRIAPWQKEK
jgi:hypothetical protein